MAAEGAGVVGAAATADGTVPGADEDGDEADLIEEAEATPEQAAPEAIASEQPTSEQAAPSSVPQVEAAQTSDAAPVSEPVPQPEPPSSVPDTVAPETDRAE
jgi:hypothetical protein